MKKILRIIAILLVSMSLVACGSKESDDKRLYFVTLNDQGPYWIPLIESAKDTAKEKGYELVVKAGVAGDPSRPQKLMEAIQEGIDQNVSGIAMAALDPKMFDNKAFEAQERGIKVVTFDTDIATEGNRLAYIGTDNFNAGYTLGKNAAKDLKAKGINKGTLSTITYSGSAQNMIERYAGLKKGFNEEMGESNSFKWLEWIINDLSASEAKNQLEAQMTSNSDLVSVFTLGTESVIAGTMEAMKSQNKSGELFHYGFDYSDTFLAGIDEGLITAIVDQNSSEMGKVIVEKLIEAVEGKKIDNNYPINVNW